MRFLVTLALNEEFAPWRRLRHFARLRHQAVPLHQSEIGPATVHVALTGMGWERAARLVPELLREPYDLCIAAGFAGALKHGLKCGDFLVPAAVVASGAAEPVECSSELYAHAEALGAVPVSKLVTVPHVIGSPAEKRDLAHLADAVDMESYPILSAARQNGIPVCALRVVSDEAGEPMPIDFNRTSTPAGQVSKVRVLRELARRPARLGAMLRFSRRNRAAARRLAEFLDAFFKNLPAVGGIPERVLEGAAK